jgi:hypothetical protein
MKTFKTLEVRIVGKPNNCEVLVVNPETEEVIKRGDESDYQDFLKFAAEFADKVTYDT